MTSGGEPAGSPMPFLLDTHIWYWYLKASERLPKGLRRLIDSAPGGLWVSPISVWELGMLHERGRITLTMGLRAWVEAAHSQLPVQETVLNREVAIVSREIDLPHEDPADRFLAATSLVYGLTLMTVDRRLTAARWLPTRSR